MATTPLSGDIEGMASSHPDGLAASSPLDLPKGKIAGSSNPHIPAAEPVRQPASSPTAPPTALETDSPGNPFAGDGGGQPAGAETEDAPGNPFADSEPAPAPAAPLPTPAAPGRRAMQAVVDTNLAAHRASAPEPAPGETPKELTPDGFLHDFLGGLGVGAQRSIMGLSWRQQNPTAILPEHADMAMRIGSQISQFAGDLPAMAAGLVAGAAVGTVEAPVVGTIGLGAAGAFAAPAAVRKLMMDHFDGKHGDKRDFVASLMASTWEGVKGGATGLAATVGGVALKPLGMLAEKTAELAAMTSVGSALEGHLPSVQDFVDGAIFMGGLHGLAHVTGVSTGAPTDVEKLQGKLKEMYASTGEHPADIVKRAAEDVELKQKLLAGNAQEPLEATPTTLVHEEVKEPAKAEGEPAKIIGTETKLEPKTEAEVAGGGGKEPPAPTLTSLGQEYEDRAGILEKVGVSDEPTKKSLGERWDDFYAKHVDFLDPLNVAIKEAIAKGAEIKTSAYDLGRLVAAHMDKTRSFLEFGTRDGKTGEINGEGLNEIYRDTPNMDMNGLRAYAMAKQALDLDKRGIQPWENFDREQSQRYVDATKDQFEDVNQRRIAFANRVLEYARDKGLFSQAQIDAMNEKNPNYSPSNRAFEADEFTGKVRGGSAVKEIVGSARQVVDPILQTYKNTENIIKRSLINETRTTFVDNMREGGMLNNPDPEQNFLRKSAGDFPLGENEIVMYRDGVRETYEGSPGVIDSLKRLDGDTTAMDLTTKILRGFSNAVRVGVVSNPAFGFAHFFRSQIMSSVYSQTGMLPFQSLFSLGEFMRKGEDYQNWVYNGGASGSLFKLNETYLQDNKVYEANKQAPFLEKAWNVVRKPFEASEAFIKLTDNLSRFTEYQRSLKQGVEPLDAAMRSRNVVPDYAMCGMQRSVLRTGVAFIGAHINSLARMGEEIENDLKGFAMKMAVISGMSAALWAVNKDDEAIDAIPDWQKNTYWNINLSRFSPGYRGPQDATILRLPKPWSPGILFGSGAELALDEWFKPREQEANHFAVSVMKSVAPELVPNMAQPILDQYSNKQSFTGRPLVPFYQEKELPEMQYGPYTSETAKQLGKIIGYVPMVKDLGPSADPLASPAVVENYIKTWGGTLGGWALHLSDAALKKAGIGEQQDKMVPWQDTPFIHQFVSRYPSFNDQRLQDFYENRDEADKAYNTQRQLAKRGDFDAAERIRAAHPDFQVRLDGIAKSISGATKQYQLIQSMEMAPEQKRQQLDSLLFQIGSMAKMGNEMMGDFKRGQVQNNGQQVQKAVGE